MNLPASIRKRMRSQEPGLLHFLGKTLTVEVDPDDANLLQDKDRWRAATASVERVLGRPIRLRKKLAKSAVASLCSRRNAARTAHRKQLEERACEHPTVKKAEKWELLRKGKHPKYRHLRVEAIANPILA